MNEKQTPYWQKLLDPRWQKKRLEILSRDAFTCTACAADNETLHVHHAYYVSGREPWNYPDWSLTTYCKDCHKIFQEIARDELQAFEQLIDFFCKADIDVMAMQTTIDDLRCSLRMNRRDIANLLIAAAKSKLPTDRVF